MAGALERAIAIAAAAHEGQVDKAGAPYILTKREGEDYEAFIRRVAPIPIAWEVKLADLRDKDGYWVKIDAWEVGRSNDIPHGIRYEHENYPGGP